MLIVRSFKIEASLPHKISDLDQILEKALNDLERKEKAQLLFVFNVETLFWQGSGKTTVTGQAVLRTVEAWEISGLERRPEKHEEEKI